MKRTKALEAIAYHEAGHAVTCWHQHIGLKHLSIVPGEDWTGQIVHDRVFKRYGRPDIAIGLALEARVRLLPRTSSCGMFKLARSWTAGGVSWRRLLPRFSTVTN